MPERVLARFAGSRPGPTVVAIGGIHGNEPAGPAALARVAEALSDGPPLARGEFVAMVGNLAALQSGQRFVDRDLNRDWATNFFDRLGGSLPRDASAEDAEQDAIARELQDAFARARGEVFLLDLHTTSGAGRPFIVIADALRSRRFALALPNPLILGLEEHLTGTLIDCVTNLGHAAMAFEGGQNEAPGSVDHNEAAVWIALDTAGLLDDAYASRVRQARDVLRLAASDLPHALEVGHRHAVTPGDGFIIEPGLAGFEPVRRGQVLAQDHRGPIVANESGYLLMPKYQSLGDDGFFVVHRVRGFWLSLSALLRTLRFDRFVHWLPGVRRDPAHAGDLVVDRRVARFFALEVLHLLGFKRISEVGRNLRMRRRTAD